jgi:hypothetical protein
VGSSIKRKAFFAPQNTGFYIFTSLEASFGLPIQMQDYCMILKGSSIKRKAFFASQNTVFFIFTSLEVSFG